MAQNTHTPRGPDLLRSWIGDRTAAYVATLLGVSASHLSHWICGRRIPNIKHALAIAELTDGAVPIESWL